jgi:hypothetical protein
VAHNMYSTLRYLVPLGLLGATYEVKEKALYGDNNNYTICPLFMKCSLEFFTMSRRASPSFVKLPQ